MTRAAAHRARQNRAAPKSLRRSPIIEGTAAQGPVTEPPAAPLPMPPPAMLAAPAQPAPPVRKVGVAYGAISVDPAHPDYVENFGSFLVLLDQQPQAGVIYADSVRGIVERYKRGDAGMYQLGPNARTLATEFVMGDVFIVLRPSAPAAQATPAA